MDGVEHGRVPGGGGAGGEDYFGVRVEDEKFASEEDGGEVGEGLNFELVGH